MTGNEYQELAMRTNDGNSTNRMLDACPRDWKTGDLLNGILGLAGYAACGAEIAGRKSNE